MAALVAGLTRVKCPWTLADQDWTEQEVRKAVIWLAQTTGKAISRLLEDDFNAHGLQVPFFFTIPSCQMRAAEWQCIQRIQYKDTSIYSKQVQQAPCSYKRSDCASNTFDQVCFEERSLFKGMQDEKLLHTFYQSY